MVIKMMEFLKQISIFMLLGKTLLHFCPSKKYEKYLKLLFGFMVVLQFAAAGLSFGAGEAWEAYEKRKVYFERQLEQSLDAVEEKWFVYQEQIETRIIKEKEEAEELVQEKIRQQQETEEGEQEQFKETEEVADGQTKEKSGQEREKKEEQVERVDIKVTVYE